MSDRDRDETLERARRAYRRLQADAGPREAPDDGALVDLVLGRLEGERRRRVADAVVASPDLSARVRELMEVHRVAAAELDLRAHRAPAARRFRPMLAAAAVFLAVAGLTWWALRPAPPEPDALRGGPAGPAPALQPDDGAALAAPPDALRWAPVPGASTYRAVLYDFESSVVWESPETPATEVEIPPDVREAMAPGSGWYWRVVYREGIVERRTALRRFRVEP